MATISLSPMWTSTASVGAPRVAAIEHPFGLTLGRPGDADGQRAVLRTALAALESIDTPGGVAHLPFEWDTKPKPRMAHPKTAPPIVALLRRKPWLLLKLMSRQPPDPG